MQLGIPIANLFTDGYRALKGLSSRLSLPILKHDGAEEVHCQGLTRQVSSRTQKRSRLFESLDGGSPLPRHEQLDTRL